MLCDECGAELEIGDWPFCRGDRNYHAKRWARHRMTELEVDLGSFGKHKISSIQDADRLQRMAKEKGQEISFRAFNNDPSNQDRNSMGENPQVPFKTRNRRGIPFVTRRGQR